MKEDIHGSSEVLEAGKNLYDAERALIMFHGRGASAHGMLQLAEQLPEAAVLAPQATRREWYPRSFLEPIEKNQPHLDSALGKVDKLVERAAEAVGKEKVVLIGFSQGACLISEYAARNPDQYGGIIPFSGGLIGEEIGEFNGDLEESSVFVGCAENDPHIPLERVEHTVEVFEELNANLEKHIFSGSNHGITEYEIEKAGEIIEDL